MTATVHRLPKRPRFRDPTTIDKAKWVAFGEYTRANPAVLPFMRQRDREAYEWVSAGLRTLAIEARSAEWRSPLGGIGGRPEQLIPGTAGSFSNRTDWLTFLLCGGRGCVAAGTMIEDPFGGPSVPVEDFAGGWVTAVDEDGALTPALAGPSYLKGSAPLFRVATDRGDEIVVTDQHRFLTPSGWATLADIAVGDAVASLPDRAGRSASPGDARRSTRTTGGCWPGCRRSPRSRGRRLRQGLATGPARTPSPTGALVRSQIGSGEGGWASSPARTHPGPESGPPSRKHSDPAEPSPADGRSHGGPSIAGPTPPDGRTGRRSPLSTTPRRSTVEAPPDQDRAASSLAPPAVSLPPVGPGLLVHGEPERPSTGHNRTPGPDPASTPPLGTDPPHPRARPAISPSAQHTSAVVVEIEPLGVGDYYDLTVPGYANYAANGLVNHNSGKSRTGAEAIRELILGRRWLRPPRVALVGQELDSVRIEMVENTLLQVLPPGSVRKWNRQSVELWLSNGAFLKGYSSETPRKLRGPNFHLAWCFPGDAPVTMADGTLRPIAEVEPGELVASAAGPAEVLRAVMTRRDADVWALPLEDGTVVEATPDHPVWVVGRGWTRLDRVTPGDKLEPCSSMARPPGSPTPESVGTATGLATTRIRSGGSYTAGSTSTMSARSTTSSTSTTSTTTPATTTRATSRRSPSPTTSGATAPGERPDRSIGVRAPLPCGPNGSRSPGSASSARSHTSPDRRTPGSVPSSARAEPAASGPICAVATASPLRTADVYDLTTTAGEFYAYGVRVHNCDELATWKDANVAPSVDSTWSNLKFATRARDGLWLPRIIATTTPKPVRLLRNPNPDDPIHSGPGIYDDPTTVVSSMSTLENMANLPEHYRTTVVEPLRGTRLYDQEVLGLLVDAVLGALWSHEEIELMWVPRSWAENQSGGLVRIVVAVDPSVGAGVDGSECGIVVVGLGRDQKAYVLHDGSLRGPPRAWSQRISELYYTFDADYVVAEVNQGFSLVSETMGRYAPSIPVKSVAGKRNKRLRAEPVAILSAGAYEANQRVKLAATRANLRPLTTQMTTWDGTQDSPDRLDAMVYGVLECIQPGGVEELVTVLRGLSDATR